MVRRASISVQNAAVKAVKTAEKIVQAAIYSFDNQVYSWRTTIGISSSTTFHDDIDKYSSTKPTT